MVVGAVLDGEGYPVHCELPPGNTCYITSLVPIVERLCMCFANRGYCNYLLSQGECFTIDEAAVACEARLTTASGCCTPTSI